MNNDLKMESKNMKNPENPETNTSKNRCEQKDWFRSRLAQSGPEPGAW